MYNFLKINLCFINYKGICLLVFFPFFLTLVLVHVLTDCGAALVIPRDFPTGCFRFVAAEMGTHRVDEVKCGVYR